MANSEKLVDTKQAAEILGVSASVMRRWRNSDKGPKYAKLEGYLVRYKVSELQAWLDRQSQTQGV